MAVVACMVVSLPPAGCKRKSVVLLPTTAPAGTRAPSPAKVAAARADVVLLVEDRTVTLPPTELRAGGDDVGGFSAHLVTPAGGADAGGLHFDMTFPDVADSNELDGAEWRFVRPAGLTGDTEDEALDAITLPGEGGPRLEPMDVTVTVRRAGEARVQIELQGTFRYFDPPDAAEPARTVTVSGEFPAKLRIDAPQ